MKRASNSGFTLIEMLVSVGIAGVVLLAVMGVFVLMQRSATQLHQASHTQQNARMAVDYITEHLRQAGAGTDYVRGQQFLVHAGPYQLGFNGDIDNGQTINGEVPLVAIDLNTSPNTVPASGNIMYSPPRSYDSMAETIVLTLDSDDDGLVSSGDQGDDSEEDGHNPNLFVLKRVSYGSDGANGNVVRDAPLAVVRGPGGYPDGTLPQPLFQYFYDNDDDAGTDEILWGDTSGNGKLETTEIASLAAMPAANLSQVRRIRVTVTAESKKVDSRYSDRGGFLGIEMASEVYVRNATRSSSVIYGQVYHDVDGDGDLGNGETGIPDVTVKLIGLSRSTLTNGIGFFYIPIDAGSYAVQETDPAGFASTTPNLVSVTVTSGAATLVNFGDQTGGPIGAIKGKVFDDTDQDGVISPGEVGLPDVLVTLDSGEQAATDQNGDYAFVIPVGTYNVVEIDPEGFGSTTPNDVEVTLVANGDTIVVDFGDAQNVGDGTIEGYVFDDDDQDGARDTGEAGIPNVTVGLSSSDSTTTNASGFYRFAIAPGVYDITERDPPGYTSSTFNVVSGVVIAPDTTVNVNFGDFLLSNSDFIEIDIGNTARALSVEATDLGEDNKGDIDIIVGTPFSAGTGNLLVFHNKRKNSNTALSQLFDNVPTYQRDAGSNINSLHTYDFNADDNPDVLSGLEENTSSNVQIWFDGNTGSLSNSPDEAYSTNAFTYVMDLTTVDLDLDGDTDLLAGMRSSFGTFTGAFETFRGTNSGFTSWNYHGTAGSTGTLNLGQVWALDTGDIDGDGDLDVVVGSKTNTYSGYIDVFTNTGSASGNFQWTARYWSPGAVNDVLLVDMAEDDQRDLDLLVGVSTGRGGGVVAMYLNTSGIFGTPDQTGAPFAAETTPHWPDDMMSPNAEVMSLAAALINPDIFPDVFVGTRTATYAGDVHFLETFGFLPTNGEILNVSSIGEVVGLKIADFNKDLGLDVLLGTRVSSSQGKLLIFFYND